jgi:hypothetical protein
MKNKLKYNAVFSVIDHTSTISPIGDIVDKQRLLIYNNKNDNRYVKIDLTKEVYLFNIVMNKYAFTQPQDIYELFRFVVEFALLITNKDHLEAEELCMEAEGFAQRNFIDYKEDEVYDIMFEELVMFFSIKDSLTKTLKDVNLVKEMCLPYHWDIKNFIKGGEVGGLHLPNLYLIV